MDREAGTYTGIFLISTAALMLEIELTRVLAIALWHHFAFLVISIALFGIAASGTYLSLSQKPETLEHSLGAYSISYSLATVTSYLLSNRIPFDPYRFSWDRLQMLYLLLHYLLLSTPFFFFGLCMAASLTAKPEKAGALYSANLTGSGAGVLTALALSTKLPGEDMILLSALLGAIAALSFSKRNRSLAMALSLSLLLLLHAQPQALDINISPYKALRQSLTYPGSKVVLTSWNAISRVDVVESGYVRHAPGLSLLYNGTLPRQLGLAVDGNAMTAITEFNGSPLGFTAFLPSSLAYSLIPGSTTLVIEPGGGLPVIEALSNGAREVKAIEPNPLITATLLKLNDFSQVYTDPRVEVIQEEVRSFLLHSDDSFDVIAISPSASAPASSTGVYALTENYLFTVEAFEEYLQHLSPQGMLSVTRLLHPPPREALRVLSLSIKALREMGVEEPERNIAVIKTWGTITVLVKRTPFTDEESEALSSLASLLGFEAVHLPGSSATELEGAGELDEYHSTINALLKGEEGFYDRYLFDITPPTDERPFFFHFFKLRRLLDTYRSTGGKWQIFVEGGYIVYLLFSQALLLCLLLILLPLASRGHRAHLSSSSPLLAYFFLIGAGYMLVEIPLIQSFILYLGKPVYAVSAVLISLLVFSGIGSLITMELTSLRAALRLSLGALALVIPLHHLLLPRFLGIPGWWRLLLSAVSLAPLGLLMGMPLPLGIRLARRFNPELIPWAWAANGSASVLSSILAVLLAMHTGFSSVLLLASLVYAASLATLLLSSQPRL